MEVSVKPLTFFDIQRAMEEMIEFVDGEAIFKFQAYWQHAFTHWITATNPALTTQELLSLSPYIGEQISKILPKPDEMTQRGGGDFREPIETE